jgi:ADP-heptose:LPS heptosyltransferase
MQRELLDLLEIATGTPQPTPRTLDLPISDAHRADAARLLPDGPLYVGLAPGSGGKPKCWPLERFIRLGREQADKGRVPVYLIGPQERDWEAEIRAQVPGALFPLQEPGVEEAHGFSPLFTVALAERLAAGVANDSGVGHMMAIGAKPLVCLYGGTVPEKFMPMTDKLTVIRAADFGGREMTDIPYEAVSAAVDAAL